MSEEDFSSQLRKAFQEMQVKVTETNKRLQHGEVLKKVHEQKLRVGELAKVQLKQLESDRPVYKCVGRMFARETVKSEIDRIENEVKEAKDKMVAIDRQREYLTNSLAEAEKNLRELVHARP